LPKSKSKRVRYQPPPRPKPKPSPPWLGPAILMILFAGVAIIVLNYLGVGLPGGTSNLYLWVGLGLIALGFGAATQWR
jgi:ABC-type Fe3+ transport system permease subunit